MYSDWQAAARATIAQVTKDLPSDATLAERRKVLRAAAHDFHGGTSWGRKVWSKHCRKYLEQHGLPPLAQEIVARPRTESEFSKARRVNEAQRKMLSPDISFPFRGQG